MKLKKYPKFIRAQDALTWKGGHCCTILRRASGGGSSVLLQSSTKTKPNQHGVGRCTALSCYCATEIFDWICVVFYGEQRNHGCEILTARHVQLQRSIAGPIGAIQRPAPAAAGGASTASSPPKGPPPVVF